jgi:hypothetical protein
MHFEVSRQMTPDNCRVLAPEQIQMAVESQELRPLCPLCQRRLNKAGFRTTKKKIQLLQKWICPCCSYRIDTPFIDEIHDQQVIPLYARWNICTSCRDEKRDYKHPKKVLRCPIHHQRLRTKPLARSNYSKVYREWRERYGEFTRY